MKWRGYGILFLSAALVASACGSEDQDAGSAGEVAAPVADNTDAAEALDASVNEQPEQTIPEFVSPLNDALGFEISGDGGNTEARIQDEIVACMAERGFEYTPSGQSIAGMLAGATVDDGLQRGTPAWVARYGFGVSTLAFTQEQVGPNLIGNTNTTPVLGVTDANREYVESLDPATQAAYYEALYGITAESIGAGLAEGAGGLADGAGGEDMLDGLVSGVSEGCEAQASTLATGGVDFFSLFLEFGAEVAAIGEAVENDPRVIELQRSVDECLAGKGLDFRTPADVRADLTPRVSAIQSAALVGNIEVIPSAEDLANQSMLDLQDLLNQSATTTYRLTDAHKAELAVIQAEEVELAQTFIECGSGLRGITEDPVYNEVRIEVEERFVEENFERLTTFRDSQG